MIKKSVLWILNLLWRIQFKETSFRGPVGYHCRECSAGKMFYCGNFYCPMEEKPLRMLEYRFNNVKYQNLLNKWRTSIL